MSSSFWWDWSLSEQNRGWRILLKTKWTWLAWDKKIRLYLYYIRQTKLISYLVHHEWVSIVGLSHDEGCFLSSTKAHTPNGSPSLTTGSRYYSPALYYLSRYSYTVTLKQSQSICVLILIQSKKSHSCLVAVTNSITVAAWIHDTGLWGWVTYGVLSLSLILSVSGPVSHLLGVCWAMIL